MRAGRSPGLPGSTDHHLASPSKRSEDPEPVEGHPASTFPHISASTSNLAISSKVTVGAQPSFPLA